MSLIKKKRNQWSVAISSYLVLLLITSVSLSITFTTYENIRLSEWALYNTNSFYASESGIEQWLLKFKRNPNIEDFQSDELMVKEARSWKMVEYNNQVITRKDKYIEEVIAPWESIQLIFKWEELNPNITRFHIAYMKYDTETPPIDDLSCNTPRYWASTELWILASEDKILGTTPNYANGCDNWKNDLQTYSDLDDVSLTKIVYTGFKCILNAWIHTAWNTAWIETNLSYTYDNQATLDTSDDTCNFDVWNNSMYYLTDQDIIEKIKWYLRWYTMVSSFDPSDFTDNASLLLNIKSLNEETSVLVWATDEVGNVYEIPWRYVTLSAIWQSTWKVIDQWVYNKLKVKKKINKDLLPIFDYSLFSEMEFIK